MTVAAGEKREVVSTVFDDNHCTKSPGTCFISWKVFGFTLVPDSPVTGCPGRHCVEVKFVDLSPIDQLIIRRLGPAAPFSIRIDTWKITVLLYQTFRMPITTNLNTIMQNIGVTPAGAGTTALRTVLFPNAII